MRGVLVIVLVLAGAGALAAAWHVGGPAEAVTGALALGLNAVILLVTAPVVRRMAVKKGSLAGGKAFVYMGAVRIALLLGGGWALAHVPGVQWMHFWCWAVALYVLLLLLDAFLTSMFLAGRPTRV
jgi:hypothetical protein